jgi:HPt (histidine-containing phosphotransfer) domain-containing protein
MSFFLQTCIFQPASGTYALRNIMNDPRLSTRVLELRNRFIRSLPDRIAAIMENLRERQGSSERGETLDRQFHNLAGTAGTFGFFAIAAAAADGFDECVGLDGGRIEGDARYLWSIVEELADQACDPLALERTFDAGFHPMHEVQLPAGPMTVAAA